MLSPTLAINEHTLSLEKEGKIVYKLGFGQSPFPVPPTVVEALKQHAFQKDYLPVKGLWALREAVASHYKREYSLPLETDQIMIGPGSKALIFLAQFCGKYALLLPSPSWVSYAPQAALAGKSVHWISTKSESGWKLLPSDLEKACRQITGPKLLILNYPNNPTGSAYESAEMENLVIIARKYDLLIISDEIYGRLTFSDIHPSIVDFYPEGTIISSGLSKWCGAGGWRLGTFVFPKQQFPLMEKMAEVGSEIFSCVSAPIQYAAISAFQESDILNTYLFHSKKILQTIATFVQQSLTDVGAICPPSQGGFYLFPCFEPFRNAIESQGISTGSALCMYLLDELGIALLPGEVFGRPKHEFTFRLSYVDFDGQKALDFLENGGEFPGTPESIQTHFPKIYESTQLISSWIKHL